MISNLVFRFFIYLLLFHILVQDILDILVYYTRALAQSEICTISDRKDIAKSLQWHNLTGTVKSIIKYIISSKMEVF